MPMVGSKKFPYTMAGKKAAVAASKKMGKPMKSAAKSKGKKK